MPHDDTARAEREQMLHYDLRLIETESATGYFACIPVPDSGVSKGLHLLRQRPFDDFLRKHMLQSILSWDVRQLEDLAADALQNDDPVILSLLYEAGSVAGKHVLALQSVDLDRLAAATSLIDIKAGQMADRSLHNQWVAVFRENILRHKPFSQLNTSQLPPLFDRPLDQPVDPAAPEISDLFAAKKEYSWL